MEYPYLKYKLYSVTLVWTHIYPTGSIQLSQIIFDLFLQILEYFVIMYVVRLFFRATAYFKALTIILGNLLSFVEFYLIHVFIYCCGLNKENRDKLSNF